MCNPALRNDISEHSLLGTGLQNTKDHLKITDDEEDTLITEYIEASTERIEEKYGLSIRFSRNVSFYQYCSYCPCFKISRRYLCTVEKVEYLSDGAYVELLPADYEVFETSLNTFVQINSSITVDPNVPDQIKITYVLGFTKTFSVESVVKVSDELTITTTNDNGLVLNDLTCLTSEIPEYNGLFQVLEIVSTKIFKINVQVGDPDPTGAFELLVETVPSKVQVGIKQMVAMMYANRGDCSDKCGSIPCCTTSLLKGYKKTIIRTPGKDCGC